MKIITETIDSHMLVLTADDALCIVSPSGQTTTLDLDTAAALWLFLEPPDVDQRLEERLIAQETAA